jgi:hypothetical protein
MGVVGQRHVPAARPSTHCIECWVRHSAGLDVCGKYRPHRDSIPGRSSRSKSLYRLSYRAHEYYLVRCSNHKVLRYVAFVTLLLPSLVRPTPFSNTLSLRSSLNMRDQVSHPHKTTDKVTVLYIFNIIFWIANRKTEHSAPNDSKHSLTSICS